MNPKFFDLPKERQQCIINGALHVFAKYDYKKASTDDIALKAGVSKSLLFHYFENKKGLYLFLYSYAYETIVREMSADHDYEETDFFKILLISQAGKLKLLTTHPDIMQFVIKSFFEENPAVKPQIDKNFAATISNSSKRFIERADASKFKDGVSPQAVLNIVIWMSEGYMRSRTPEQMARPELLNGEFGKHIELLRKQFYKPEFL